MAAQILREDPEWVQIPPARQKLIFLKKTFYNPTEISFF